MVVERRVAPRLHGTCARLLFSVTLVCAGPAREASGQEPARWRLHAVVGADGSADAASQFSQITAVALLDERGFVVADAGDCSVRYFSLDGTHLRTVGRRGGGPGEFALPAFLSVDSIVRIYDPQQHRVVLFSRTGEHLDTRRVVATRAFNISRIYPLGSRLEVGATTPLQVGSRDQEQAVVFAMDRATGALHTLASFETGLALWSASGGRLGRGLIPSKFGPGGAFGVRDTLLAIADGYAGVVRLLVAREDSLHLLREWSLGPASRPVSRSDAEAARNEWLDFMGRRGARLEELVVATPTRWSAAHRVIVQEGGYVWVLVDVGGSHSSYRIVVSPAEDAERWVVLSPAGTQSERWLPAGFSLMDVRGDVAVGVHRDEDGLETVRVYRTR
jgi:hypothetical protein